MRIGIDTQSTLGQKTGIGQYTAHLLQALRSVTLEDEYIELNRGADVLMRLDRRLRWQQFALPLKAHRARVDLLHVTGFDAPLWHPCPTLLTVHDLIGILFPQNLPPISRFYWARWLPFSIRFATHLIADSDHTRRDLVRLLGVPELRITVVPLAAGVDCRPIQENDILQALRQKYQLPLRFILFVSTIEPRKGLDTLMDAFARLLSVYGDIKLVIAGKKGWYTDRLYDQIERLELKDHITVTGHVPDEDLPALYNAAEVLAFPSRYKGFGLPVLEAMACGTPVVCSSSSSLPEVAGDAALFVPPDDPQALCSALHQLLENEALRRQMREKGLAQAARFSWEETARKTSTVYRNVIRERGSDRARYR
jgi:glycosyltransferase involved in cell wall biosynthesis